MQMRTMCGLVLLAAASALTLVGCTQEPPSCKDRLVGNWQATSLVTAEESMGVKPGEPVRFVWTIELRADGKAFIGRQYELPEKPGVRAPGSVVDASPIDGWIVGPAEDAAKADCSFAYVATPPPGIEAPSPAYIDVKFDGPDKFKMLDVPDVFERRR